MFDIGVVIPTRDKRSRLEICLRALERAAEAASCSVALAVVDDGGHDGTESILPFYEERFDPCIKVLRHAVPAGRSMARNAGAKLLDAVRLLFLDDDMIIDARLLERHARLGDTEVGRGAILHLPWLRGVMRLDELPEDMPPRLRHRINAVLADPASRTLKRFARRSRFENDIRRLFAIRGQTGKGLWFGATGGNLSAGKKFFNSLGGFDSRLGLEAAAEDLEFGLRTELHGGRVVMISEPQAIHLDHPKVARPDDYFTNHIMFGKIHGVKLARQMEEYFKGGRDILAVGTVPDGV